MPILIAIKQLPVRGASEFFSAPLINSPDVARNFLFFKSWHLLVDDTSVNARIQHKAVAHVKTGNAKSVKRVIAVPYSLVLRAGRQQSVTRKLSFG